jgi:hypothetical protein
LLNDFFHIELREFSDGQISALLTRMSKHHHPARGVVRAGRRHNCPSQLEKDTKILSNQNPNRQPIEISHILGYHAGI